MPTAPPPASRPRQRPRWPDAGLAALLLALAVTPELRRAGWPVDRLLPALPGALGLLALGLILLRAARPGLDLRFGYTGARWTTLAGMAAALAMMARLPALPPVTAQSLPAVATLAAAPFTALAIALPPLVVLAALLYAMGALLLDRELGVTRRRARSRRPTATGADHP